MPDSLDRPGAADCPSYYARYVERVPDGDVLNQLESQLGGTLDLLAGLDDSRASFRYAPDKWSVKDIVLHLSDTERVFAARLLHFGRHDPTPLPGFEQDDYVVVARADERGLSDLLRELEAVRGATMALCQGLPHDAWRARGTASGVEFSAHALPWIMAGHELHHRAVIEERYLS
jgi:hypothetical protein